MQDWRSTCRPDLLCRPLLPSNGRVQAYGSARWYLRVNACHPSPPSANSNGDPTRGPRTVVNLILFSLDSIKSKFFSLSHGLHD